MKNGIVQWTGRRVLLGQGLVADGDDTEAAPVSVTVEGTLRALMRTPWLPADMRGRLLYAQLDPPL